MAARIRHPFGGRDRSPVRLGQLCKAIIPVRLGAVRGRSVDYAGRFVLDQADRVPRRRVRQAEEYDVDCIEEPAALLGVLAFVLVDQQQLEVVRPPSRS